MRVDEHDVPPGPDGQAGDDAFAARIAAPLRAPVRLAPDFTARVMRAVRGEARPGAAPAPRAARTPWWRRRVTLSLSLSPVGALAMAAAVAAVAVLGREVARRAAPAPAVRVAAVARTDTVHMVRFVFLAPNARSVALVGDFNEWRSASTPLRRAGTDGLWTATVSLPAGAHQYAFIVNGTRWVADPAAPTTVSDDFGTTTSVITVGGAAG